MEGLGKERSICSARTPSWLERPENIKVTLAPPSKFWKLADCFSSSESTAPTKGNQKNYMDSPPPVLELKDVPPPPRPAASQPFPLAPLPMLPPCLPSRGPLPPLLQPSSPKVSSCSCPQCKAILRPQTGLDLLGTQARGFGDVCGGGVSITGGAGGGGSSVYLSKPLGAASSWAVSSTSTSSSSSSVPHHVSLFSGPAGQVLSSSSLAPVASSLAPVATSQPAASLSQLPCCSGLLKPLHAPTCPQLSQAYGRPRYEPCPSVVAVATAAPSAGYYRCGGELGSGAAGKQPQQQKHPLHLHHGGLSTSPAHVCSHPLHHCVNHTVSLKGAHYCQDCLSKPAPGLASEPDKLWPNIPPPHAQSAPIPIPMCNGCGVSGASVDGLLLLGSSLGKTSQKYGSPDSGSQESLPPVGVFWDIENCSVPTGRSAASVVQRLRARFFPGHREAEFICVCDISKENKDVIQELNNCQVTVAHINATAKNAADDKLRQSLRRFADTHTAPATVVLVSSDVNFASELSDLRHRHGFQVILVHKNQVSGALLQHAHRHVAFEEFLTDLPPRMPLKSQPGFNLLFVHNLPTNRDGKSVANRLRRLSDNCGGKVLGLSGGTAVLRFSSQEAAERARKRMENEDVYGCRIHLSFSPEEEEEEEEGLGRGGGGGGGRAEEAADGDSDHGVRRFPLPSAVPSSSSSSSLPASLFLPVEKPRSPRRPRRVSTSASAAAAASSHVRPCQQAAARHLVPERPYSPRKGAPRAANRPSQELGPAETKPRMGFLSDKSRASSASPHTNGDATLQNHQRAGPAGDAPYRGKRREISGPRSATDSPVDHFQVSTPSAFSKLSLQRSFSPMLLPQGSWSSRSGSPCLSNRSSPLSAPRSPGPDASAPTEPFSDGADIQVSNLDYRMSRKELQQILQDTFAKHGKVKGVELSPHTDYQLKATIQMRSLQQAIGAIGALHRYKIGGKRIQVSLLTGANNKSLAVFSSEIISILQDAPASCLPLFKFTEIYEKKFGHKLVVSELYRLPEVVAVREQGGGRLVCLLPSGQSRQSPLGSSQSHGGSSASGSPVVFEELEYHEPVCKRHYNHSNFSEADYDPDSYKIPFVVVSVKTLAAQVHSLLQSHEGTIPLLSFPECYAAEFSPLTVAEEGELEDGVPLEHLITCVPGVTVVTAQNGFKVIKWIHNKPPPPNADPWVPRCKSPVGNPQLIQFSRELVDLLKGQPTCLMPLSRFIPAYHHHFAKQCRVSDYGYSKLLELLEAVPHVLQILGLGSKRLLTLTHRSQVKRFTQDLLKLLKFQASKQVVIRDFMQAYHWCFSRDWRVIDYGMCDLMDLLTEIPDTTITITQQDNDMVISVPKRERTAEEQERTRQFAKEVVDLLRHQPHGRMAFSKFIPTYHHHFGRQCKLTHYGFTKLVELFEAIPDVLMVLECGEEKVLCLTEVERVKALAAQLVKLLRAQRDGRLPVQQLLAEYSKTFGYGLRLQDYDANSLPELLNKLCHVVKAVDGPEGREVQLINRKSLRALTSQLLALLMGLAPGKGEGAEPAWPSVEQLQQRYEAANGVPLNPCEYGFLSLGELLKSLPFLVELYEAEEEEDAEAGRVERVRLTRLYQFARSVRALLHTYHYHQIFLSEFPAAFSKYTGVSLQWRAYGYSTLDELLAAIPQVIWIKGHGHKKILVLKNEMKARTSSGDSPGPEGDRLRADSQSPSSAKSGNQSPGGDAELLCLGSWSPVDLLCGPVPSCLPSPQLQPDPVSLQPADDLIHFEERAHAEPETAEPASSEEPRLSSASAPDVCDCSAQPLDSDSQGDRANTLPCADAHADAGTTTPPPPATSTMATEQPQPPSLAVPTTDSPSKRTTRNKVKLAANFSFTPVTTA
ncbi:meiosis regulator and mRNA stability factor 1 isoform X3 [Alosa sapidissima]|uniref:meiosis regulator and mRNA stability factor 1 isoform X3 n=1 Tax=Alosa sapidissima TaxID=34773 RepID=UPI001C0A5D99|nr:meiosis regulator and mRNA stability factor 1 isoform X3 [Alosa sapidissima]